ncbi:MAG: NADH-quinone oxidoreductase subunit NuoE [Candidatus Bathyarchaeum sp.]|nr:MAG: NADH-quinone oxidoreductase subunit NuoE [Candidatus Bathyarchaeum sp.]
MNLSENITEHGKIDKIMKNHSWEESELISILHEIENLYDYLPAWALRHISEKLNIPLIQVYGVASFYNAFHLTQHGKYIIRVCEGTACHVKGGHRVMEEFERKLNIEAGETTKDLDFTLERVNCLGCCALGPMVMVDDKYYGQMSPAKLGSLIKQLKKTRIDHK